MTAPSRRKEYARLYMRKYRRRTKNAADKKRDKRRCRESRLAVLNLYGRVCVCCGETTEQFLALDHVNSDGQEERKLYGSGSRFYRWLLKQPYDPSRYQILCHNCNMAKSLYGLCPHQEAHESNYEKAEAASEEVFREACSSESISYDSSWN